MLFRSPIEEKAVDIYTKGLEMAREMRSFNKWTQLMTEKLSVMRPALYKVGKTPIFSIDSKLDSGYPVIITLDKAEKKRYQKAGMGESGSEENPKANLPSKEEAEK